MRLYTLPTTSLQESLELPHYFSISRSLSVKRYETWFFCVSSFMWNKKKRIHATLSIFRKQIIPHAYNGNWGTLCNILLYLCINNFKWKCSRAPSDMALVIPVFILYMDSLEIDFTILSILFPVVDWLVGKTQLI